MTTCVIRSEIDSFKMAAVEAYARSSGQAIPQPGAELIGHFAPHEGPREAPAGRANYKLARAVPLIRREDRLFPRRASAPRAPLVRP